MVLNVKQIYRMANTILKSNEFKIDVERMNKCLSENSGCDLNKNDLLDFALEKLCDPIDYADIFGGQENTCALRLFSNRGRIFYYTFDKFDGNISESHPITNDILSMFKIDKTVFSLLEKYGVNKNLLK